MDQLSALNSEIEPLRQQLFQHPVYRAVNSVRRLQLFMEQHVFCRLGLHVAPQSSSTNQHLHDPSLEIAAWCVF
jgi:hypothetical protein